MVGDLGFSFHRNKRGEVKIMHNGKLASTLRDAKASKFLEDTAFADADSQQQEMARVTGNYKRGNERKAKNHARNR